MLLVILRGMDTHSGEVTVKIVLSSFEKGSSSHGSKFFLFKIDLFKEGLGV